MGKGISRIYIYDQRNCVYTSANNHVVIPQHYDTSIKPNVIVIMMPLRVNIMYNQLDFIKSLTPMLIRMSKLMMIHSHLRHLGKIIAVLPLLVIHPPQQTHHIHPHLLQPENNIYVFKQKAKLSGQNNVLNK